MSLKKDTSKGAFARKLGKPGPQPSDKPSQPSDKPTKKLNWSMEDLLNKLPQSGDAAPAAPAQSQVGQLKQIAEFASALKDTQDQAFDLSQIIEDPPKPAAVNSAATKSSAIAAEKEQIQSAGEAQEELAVHTGEALEEPQVYTGEGHEEPAVDTGEAHEEPAVYTGEALEEPQVYTGEAHEEPAVYTGEGHEEPAVDTGEAHEEPAVYTGEALEEPQVYTGEAHEEPAVYTGEGHEEPAVYTGEAHEEPAVDTGEAYKEPAVYEEEPAEAAAEVPAVEEPVESVHEIPAVEEEPLESAAQAPIAPEELPEVTADAADVESDKAEASAKTYSLEDLNAIRAPAVTTGVEPPETSHLVDADKPSSAAASLLKKAIAKKSEMLSNPEPMAATPDATATNPQLPAQQVPSQFNRKHVLEKLGDAGKPVKEQKPATDEAKPAKEAKLGMFSKRKAEPEMKSKFVQDLLSAARASKAKLQQDPQEDAASAEEALKRQKEKFSRTERMKTLIDAVPQADEAVVSPETREKTKAAKATAKAFLVTHKKQLLAGAAGLLVLFGSVAIWQNHDKAELLSEIKQKTDEKHIEEGANLCNAALAKYPDEPRLHFYKGRLLWKMMDLNGALAEFDQAVKLSPNDAEALQYRATLDLALNRMPEAAADFDRVFANTSYIASLPAQDRAIVYSNRAGAEMAIGKFNPALKDIAEALRLSPKTLLFYKARAWGQFGLKHYNEAIKQWTYVIGQAPKDPLNYIERARVEFSSNQVKAAAQDISKSLSIRPTAEAYDLKASHEHDLHQIANAIADLGQAINIAPKNWELRRKRISWLIDSKDSLSALKDFDVLESSGARKDDEWLCQNRAQARMRAGQYARAAGDYTKLLKTHPDDVWLHLHRAECYEKAGDNGLAAEDYTFLISKSSRNVDVYIRRGAIYLKDGKLQLAEADFAEALKILPNQPAVYLARGLAYGNNRLYDQALVDMRHVLEMQPGNQIARQKLREYERYRVNVASATNLPPLPANLDKGNPAVAGYQLMQSGHTDLALKKFAEAIKKDPNNAALRRYLANALVLLGRPADAAVQFQALGMLGALDSADELKYAQALVDAEQTGLAIKVYQRHLAREPGDIDARVALATLYSKMGTAGEYMCRQICQTGIALAKSKEEADRFQSIMKSKQAEEDFARAQGSGKLPSGGG